MEEDGCRGNKDEDEDEDANPEKSRTEDGGDDDDEEELQQEKEQNQQQQEPAESSVCVEERDRRADFEDERRVLSAFTYKDFVVPPDETPEERREEAFLRPFDE
jgi:hypothetical protein